MRKITKPQVRQIETFPPQPAACPEVDRITALERRCDALEKTVNKLRNRQPVREVVSTETHHVEALPEHVTDQLDQFRRDVAEFKRSQDFVLPRAFQEIVERVTALEQRPIDITPKADGSVNQSYDPIIREMAERLVALEDQASATGELYDGQAKLMAALAQTMRKLDTVDQATSERIDLLTEHLDKLHKTFAKHA